MKKVGLKYCGLCNPQLDASYLVTCLRNRLEKNNILLVTDLNDCLEGIILLNGCGTGCVQPERFADRFEPEKMILVTGYAIDRHRVEAKDLCQEIIARIQEWLDEELAECV